MNSPQERNSFQVPFLPGHPMDINAEQLRNMGYFPCNSSEMYRPNQNSVMYAPQVAQVVGMFPGKHHHSMSLPPSANLLPNINPEYTNRSMLSSAQHIEDIRAFPHVMSAGGVCISKNIGNGYVDIGRRPLEVFPVYKNHLQYPLPSLGNPGNAFPADFKPREIANMPHREKIDKWLRGLPLAESKGRIRNFGYPAVPSSQDTNSSGSFYTDVDDLLELQARVITRLYQKLYSTQKAERDEEEEEEDEDEELEEEEEESIEGFESPHSSDSRQQLDEYYETVLSLYVNEQEDGYKEDYFEDDYKFEEEDDNYDDGEKLIERKEEVGKSPGVSRVQNVENRGKPLKDVGNNMGNMGTERYSKKKRDL